MNYVMRAPEINSLLIYSGAGSGPMLQASAAWAGLSDELGAAAQSFRSSIANLASEAWRGPASALAAAVPTSASSTRVAVATSPVS